MQWAGVARHPHACCASHGGSSCAGESIEGESIEAVGVNTACRAAASGGSAAVSGLYGGGACDEQSAGRVVNALRERLELWLSADEHSVSEDWCASL